MPPVGEKGWLEGGLRPRALLWGVALSFLASSLAGLACSRALVIKDFLRFHVYLTPSALFYPTASQVRQVARAKLDRGKVAVIVGGSSRFFGSGQSPEGLWSKKLQEL